MPKEIARRNFFAYLNVYYPQTHLIKALESPDSSRPNGRLSQNQKTGGFRELVLPGNDFKNRSTVNFPRKTSRFWRPGNQP